MSAPDTATRRVANLIVLGVGLFAGADSYSHVFTLARAHGQDIVSAALLPLAGDGVIAAASAVMLVASRRGDPIPLRARVLLFGGILATVAANIAYGLPHGSGDALLSVWPVAAYVGCTECLMWMRAHTGMKRAVPVSAPVPEPASKAVPASKPARTRTPALTDAAMLTLAETRYANATKVPGIRDIKAALNCGQPNAQAVQAHLSAILAT